MKYSLTQLRKKVITTYQEKYKFLLNCPQLKTNENKPHLCIIVAIREKDKTRFSEKLLKHSIKSLLPQLRNFKFDFFIIANNGGGPNTEIGDQLCKNLLTFFKQEINNSNVIKTKTIEPKERYNNTTPWEIDLDTKSFSKKKNNFVIIQQIHKYKDDNNLPQNEKTPNAGKIRVIRDITNFLINEYEKGYQPDAIFQMDSETILQYNENYNVENKNLRPFEYLYQEFKDKKLVAISTKVKNQVFDIKTARPTNSPIASPQLGFELSNKEFLTLSGGAIISKTINYLSGMYSIATNLPSNTAEDYLLTLLLQDRNCPISSCSNIKVLNTSPKSKFSFKKELPNSHQQIQRWIEQAISAEELFPQYKGQTVKKLREYAFNVIERRIKDFIKYKDVNHLKELIVDVENLPYTIIMLKKTKAQSFAEGKADWIN